MPYPGQGDYEFDYLNQSNTLAGVITHGGPECLHAVPKDVAWWVDAVKGIPHHEDPQDQSMWLVPNWALHVLALAFLRYSFARGP